MNRLSLHDTSEEFDLPAVEAVLAGTLALMTGHAEASSADERRRMQARIAENMALLEAHPQLSMAFRCAVGKLRCHWQLLVEAGPDRGPSLQHPAPARFQ